ncbi:MAG: hypothetical protein WDA16_05635 [Candidatus Thermoplasmatota archaeon]
MDEIERLARRVRLAEAIRLMPPSRSILMACDLTDFARRLAEAADHARN